MKIVIDYDNDSIRFGSEDSNYDGDLITFNKPRTTKDLEKLIYELINSLSREKNCIISKQNDGQLFVIDEWDLTRHDI